MLDVRCSTLARQGMFDAHLLIRFDVYIRRMFLSEITSLNNLHDIIIPDLVPLWPPAPGWYVLGAIVSVTVIWAAWRWFQKWQENRYRREALVELDRLEKQASDDQQRETALASLPELAKRTALAGFSRWDVASLTGKAWLEFLDRTGSTDAFTKGSGKLLLTFSYQPSIIIEQIPGQQINELMTLVREWIKKH